MTPESEPQGGRVSRWLATLSLPSLVVLGVVVVGLMSTGGYYAYQTYDFVEHDNEFCLSCHLMVDPYERFARSAHQDLGCKDCHQPTLIQRSRMGLTQFVDAPDSLSAHAYVPNGLCASCHIDGDPERWEVVAATAGHRVHLESDDPALQGLQCVECHSSSLHEFAATDQTCAQSGCHTDSGIQLGAMSDLTIHCASCHGFNVGVSDESADAAFAALAPDMDTCLSCHAMQTVAAMPADDPHDGTCASCHNPHTQATPEEAATSCASARCHADAEELTPFHRGIAADVAADCMYCHQAHGFQVDGQNCLACHQDVFEDDASSDARAHADAAGVMPSPMVQITRSEPQASEALGTALLQATTRQEVPGFRHSEHRDLACADCHTSELEHGALTVNTLADCRSCHHSETVAADCVACHQEGSAGGTGGALEVHRDLVLSVGARPARALPFDHARHEDLSCSSCHTEGPDRSASAADCASCHEPHHEATATCASCHTPAAAGAHRRETAHVGCGGSGCHQDLPFEALERTRTVCLVCHQDQVDHRPDGDCADCHAMTGPPFGAARP
jgi:nitrate/TMAO reductase-like tetraheme cytochrome c subunit